MNFYSERGKKKSRIYLVSDLTGLKKLFRTNSLEFIYSEKLTESDGEERCSRIFSKLSLLALVAPLSREEETTLTISIHYNSRFHCYSPG